VKATCAKAGVDLVAAHASGPPSSAARGGLLLHVAGPPGPRGAVAGVLDAACRAVLPLGDDPAAVAVLAAAALTARLGALEAVAEAMSLAEAAGVPGGRAHVARLVAELCDGDGGDADGAGLAAAAARMADPAVHTAASVGAAAEDACVEFAAAGGRHALALASKAKVPAPALAAAVHHLEQVDESGGGRLDAAALVTVHRDAAGLPT
jgi:3-hydroxyisobutyrate dehydrogenase-like beta-hydroxyacid dehydrogenase